MKQKPIQVKYLRTYRNQKGNTVFVYVAENATDEQKAALKTALGDYYREGTEGPETGKYIWFSSRFVGKTAELIITSKGKVIPDQSKFDQAASLASQYGGNLGTEIAKLSARQLLGVDRVTEVEEAEPAEK